MWQSRCFGFFATLIILQPQDHEIVEEEDAEGEGGNKHTMQIGETGGSRYYIEGNEENHHCVNAFTNKSVHPWKRSEWNFLLFSHQADVEYSDQHERWKQVVVLNIERDHGEGGCQLEEQLHLAQVRRVCW